MPAPAEDGKRLETLGDLFHLLNERERDRQLELTRIGEQRISDEQFAQAGIGGAAINTENDELLDVTLEVVHRLMHGEPLDDVLAGRDGLKDMPLQTLFGTEFRGRLTHLLPIGAGEKVIVSVPHDNGKVVDGRTGVEGEIDPNDVEAIGIFLFQEYPPVEAYFADQGNFPIMRNEKKDRYCKQGDLIRLFQRVDGRQMNVSAFNQMLGKYWEKWLAITKIQPRMEKAPFQGRPWIVHEDDMLRFLYFFHTYGHDISHRLEYELRTQPSPQEAELLKKNRTS